MEQTVNGKPPWNDESGGSCASPYNDLASAIVLQAVNDYIKVIRQMWNPNVSRTKKREMILEKMELEDFFHSDWYETLCDINPDKLIYNCQLRAKEQEKETIRKKEAIRKMNKRKLKEQSTTVIKQRSGAAEQLPIAAEQMSDVAKWPPGAADQPLSVAEQLPIAAEHMPDVAKWPPGASEQLPGASDQPPSAAGELSGAAEQSYGASAQLPGALEQMPGASTQLPGASEQLPNVALAQPLSTAKRLLSTAKRLLSTAKRLLSTAGKEGIPQ